MQLNQLFKKDFLIYIVLKTIGTVLMLLAIYYSIFSKEPKYILAIGLFIISFLFTVRYAKIDKPLLATCLDKSNFVVSFTLGLFMNIGLGLLILGYIEGVETVNLNKNSFISVFLGIFIVGVGGYLFCCKRNGILK